VLPEGKQFAKTFDVSKDTFVTLTDKNIDIDSLEAMRFVESQINLFYAKFERIRRIMLHERAEQLSREGLRRVEGLAKQYAILSARVDLVTLGVEGVEKRFGSVREGMSGLVDVQTEGRDSVSRLNRIEMNYGEISTYKIKDIFLNLVEIVGHLGRRLNRVEKAAESRGVQLPAGISSSNPVAGLSISPMKGKLKPKSGMKKEGGLK